MIAPLPDLLLAAAQLALLIVLAPGLNGLIKATKARLQGRKGPSPVQPYFDLWKLLRKDSVRSEHSTAVFTLAPAAYAGAIAVAALLVPVLWLPAPLGLWGDAITLVGLLALARASLALAGLDTGSAFGGMGSSREVAVGALAEPALLLSLYAVAWRSGGTDLSSIAAGISSAGPTITAGPVLACAALIIVTIAETGRIPVDNPDTHLELTMIHEGMLLEYSGRPLGILLWATLVKQAVLFALLAACFFPWGIAASGSDLPLAFAALVLKLGVLALGVAVVESSGAKLRIFRVPELLGTASALAVLSLAAELILA